MYSLVGIDGNAYSIMSYVSKCMKRERYPIEDIYKYQEDAMKDDYNHLLRVSLDMIDRLNKKEK